MNQILSMSKSFLNPSLILVFSKMIKNYPQQLLIHPSNLLELGKSHHVPCKVTCLQVTRIFSPRTCLSANLKVEGHRKNNLEIVYDS
jgi:hypothetical protein